jgi:hypothetical protein
MYNVGHEEKTAKFRYNLVIMRHDEFVKVTHMHEASNYTCELNQIITSGRCASFKYQLAQKCVGDKRILKMEVHMSLRV